MSMVVFSSTSSPDASSDVTTALGTAQIPNPDFASRMMAPSEAEVVMSSDFSADLLSISRICRLGLVLLAKVKIGD